MAYTDIITKTDYCTGIQCPKALWLKKNRPELAKTPDGPDIHAENGKRVGMLARGYFGACTLVQPDGDKKKMADRTKELMAAGTDVIAEASFLCDGRYCAVDLLRRDQNGWEMYEVKSSGNIEKYEDDISFQYYVLQRCGVNVRKAAILHINKAYIRHGELDIRQLFIAEDCTAACVANEPAVEENIALLRDCLAQQDEPERLLGKCCKDSDHECAFMPYCGRDIPARSVFDIAGLNWEQKFQYYNQGIVTYQDVLNNVSNLKAGQRLQIETSLKNLPDHVEPEKIRSFLDELTYPVYHLDFETFTEPIPSFDDEHPNEVIPFQYSLHIEHVDGMIEHREFLAEEGKDPRRAIAESLVKDIPTDVTVTAFHKSVEQNVLKGLADHLSELAPELSEHLYAVRKNVKDLEIPFSKKAYYSDVMAGRSSIKAVLPALYPDDPALDYHNLEGVHKGDEAAAAFLILQSLPKKEREKTRNDLLKYCELDTYAMVKVLEKLRKTLKQY
ncbi:MAG: DUF2779 domain-containing protein [Lachnospiraceae bacterium]|nr:DUF2779 domain-containing protein [Lachnospiraceae bacterium]